MDRHRFDQLAQGRPRLRIACRVGLAHRRRERCELFGIAREDRRVKRHDIERFGHAGKAALQCGFFRHRRLHGRAQHGGLADALGYAIDQPRDFPRQLVDAPLGLQLFGIVAVGEALALVMIGADEFGRRPGRFEFGPQGADDGFLDAGEIETLRRWTGTALNPCGAAQPALARFVGARRHHAAAATGAAQKAGKKMPGTALHLRLHRRHIALHRLHRVEILARDQREFGHLDRLPLARGIGARNALAGVGVFQHADFIPDESARINLIAQDAVAARRMAVDRRGVPLRAARRRNLFRVETVSDLARALSGEIGGEDAAHDRGFLRIDDAAALLSGHDVITIGLAAARKPGADAARHAAPDLVRIVLAIELADETAQADQHRVDRAFMDGADFNAEECQPLVKTGKVFHVAGEAIQRLDDQHIEGVGLGGFHQIHEAVAAEERTARAGAVFPCADYFQPFARRKGLAERALILDGALALEVG